MAADEGTDPLQVILLGALGLAAAAHGLAIGSVAVATGLHGRPVLLDLDQARDVLVGLASRSAFAWTGPGPSPSTAGLLVGLAVCLLALLALGAAVLAVLRRRTKKPERVGPPSTSFATSAQSKDLAVAGPQPGRVVLGHAHGRLVATEPEHSVLVVGATRSGKTTGYAIPALREWDGPAIVLSAKSDLLHATATDRAARGEVLVYDPTGVSGYPCDGWSPLAGSATWRGAVRAANAMSKVSGTTAGLGGAGKHWERVAAQLLGPMLLAASFGASTWATSSAGS